MVHAFDFASVQVTDLDAAASFYTDVLGFTVNEEMSPPVARVFEHDEGIAFAIREPMGSLPEEPGAGCSFWFDVEDLDAVYERVAASDATILAEPEPGQFGRQFTVSDPDGYALTFHQTT